MTIHSKPQIPESLWHAPSPGNGVTDKWRGRIDIETIGHCKVLHGKIVNAARKLEFQCEEISACAPNKRCGNGFCPMCVRRVRRYLLDFASSRWLFRLKWHLVTIRVEGWTKESGDWSPFGPLGSRADVGKFLDILRRKRPKGLLAIGGIEAVYVTVENMPVGKVFHLHLLISGPSSEDIKAAAAESFNLDKAIKNNPDVKLVREGQGNFFSAFTYVFKQPLAKKSKRHHDEPGVRQTPKSNELRELMSNYGEHRVEDRLILEGLALEKGALRRVSKPLRDQIWLLPILAKVVDGSNVDTNEKEDNAKNVVVDEQTDSAEKMGNNGLLFPDFLSNINGSEVSARGVQAVHSGKHHPGGPASSSLDSTSAPRTGDVELLRLIEDDASGEHRLGIRFLKLDGDFGETEIARHVLATVHEFKRLLIGRGAASSIDFKHEAERLLDTVPPIHVRAVDRPGWYDDLFVSDLGVFGKPTAGQKQIEFNSTKFKRRAGHSEGSVQECVDELCEFLVSSDFLMLTYLCALLPPLAARVEEPQGFVVNLVGESSAGKTLALRLCQSTFAHADERDLQTFNHTVGSLPTLFSALSCTAIPFKDVKAAIEKGVKGVEKFQQMVFTTHGGDVRESLTGTRFAAPTFCIPMISDERSLAERYAAAGVELEEGDKVRCMELPVPGPLEGGVFNRVPLAEGGNTMMAERLEAFMKRHYGLIFPVWVDVLSRCNKAELARNFQACADGFIERSECKNAMEHRYARPFGLLAATAKVAASVGLLHNVDHAHGALERLYALGASRMAAGDQLLTQGLNAFILASSDRSVFPLVEHGKAPDIPHAEGFVRCDGGAILLYIKRDAFESYFEPGLRPIHTVLPSLERTRIFLKGREELTRLVKQNGMPRRRYLVFDYERLVAMVKPS